MNINHLIVFENKTMIGFNKPHGLLVHRSKIANDANEFALQWLRDYHKNRVYLAHRLDRKTSGVLLFAKTKIENSYLQSLFKDRIVQKSYQALVRGYTDDEGIIDYAIENQQRGLQEAVTHYRTIERYEIPLATTMHPTSRYSLVEIAPQTGRYHQIRKHMAHIRHPIIGDRPHGCNKQNRLWKQQYGMTTMLLHAENLTFSHKEYGPIEIYADKSDIFNNTINTLKPYTII